MSSLEAFCLRYMILSLIVLFANCNLITMNTGGRSCFLKIKIFQPRYKPVKFLSDFVRDNSLQPHPHTWNVVNKSLEKFVINHKNLCSIHLLLEPNMSIVEYIKLQLLPYTHLIFITEDCLRRFENWSFTTTYIFVHSLGCQEKAFLNSTIFPNTLAIPFPMSTEEKNEYIMQAFHYSVNILEIH